MGFNRKQIIKRIPLIALIGMLEVSSLNIYAQEAGADGLQWLEGDVLNDAQQPEGDAPNDAQQPKGDSSGISQQPEGDSLNSMRQPEEDAPGGLEQPKNGADSAPQKEENIKRPLQDGEENAKGPQGIGENSENSLQETKSDPEASEQTGQNSPDSSPQIENGSQESSQSAEKGSAVVSQPIEGDGAGNAQQIDKSAQTFDQGKETSGRPYGSYLISPNELAVVNFKPVWGEPSQNLKQIQEYIEEAHEKGVKFLVFPELCLTGYANASNPNSVGYKMILESAETKDGKTARAVAALSSAYDMWIIYGAPEKISGDKKHAYNAAFICDPQGKVQTYRKASPVEGAWCKAGTQPLVLDTERYGKIGISIGDDTFSMPELARYYAAKGCTMLASLSAQTGIGEKMGSEYKNTLEGLASREALTVLNANLLGNGRSKYQYFPGASVILKASGKGAVYYAGLKRGLNVSTKKATLLQNTEGLLANTISFAMYPSRILMKNSYNASLYASFYQRLSERKMSGKSLTGILEGKESLQIALAPMEEEANAQKAMDKMLLSIGQAAEKNADMILFPELALNGNGESINGKTVERFAQLAEEYGMYIIFGMKEIDGGRYYNTAVVAGPAGTVRSYRKIHLDKDEQEWAQPGCSPLIIQTEWGSMGILLGEDGEKYTELERFYGAMGCSSVIHLTNTAKSAWYMLREVGSFAQRDGLAVLTCGRWKKQSMAITAQDRQSQALQLNGTGVKYEGSSDLMVANVNLNGCGFQVSAFNPRFCFRLYQELKGEKPKDPDYIMYSNLADSDSRERVVAILQEHGISKGQTDTLLAWADDFYGRVYTPLTEKFKRMPGIGVDYSGIKYRVKETEEEEYLPEANSRLTAFLLLRDFVQTNGQIDRADTELMYDVEAVDTTEQFQMEKDDRANFYSLFNWVPVKGLSTLEEHTKAIQKAWEDREIVIDGSTGLSLVSVYTHSAFEDVRIVKHTGILCETRKGLLFVEKYGAREPFQVTWFHNRGEVKAYLLGREDLYEDEGEMDPIVFENGEVMGS